MKPKKKLKTLTKALKALESNIKHYKKELKEYEKNPNVTNLPKKIIKDLIKSDLYLFEVLSHEHNIILIKNTL